MIPKVLLLGVPECGIDILNEIVLGMPPLHSGNWLNQWEEDVCTSLKTMKPGEVRTGYVYYSWDLKQFLDDNQIRRFFLCKDPRDMIVAYLFYVMNDENNHIHHKYFKKHLKTMDERLMKLITGFNENKEIAKQYGLESIGYGNINHHYTRYLRWLEDPNTCIVRYECLVNDETQLLNVMKRMVDYLWNDLEQLDMTKTDYLKRFHSIQFSRAFKQASSGEWKQYFSDDIKAEFKEVAGELLIFLGYENDFDW